MSTCSRLLRPFFKFLHFRSSIFGRLNRSTILSLSRARADSLPTRAMTDTKRKAPISKRAFLAFIKACLVTCAALEKDTTTPRKALFKRSEELLSEVVRETAAYTERNNMRFSPVNLPKGARWGKYGLTAPFIIVLGHFETSSLNLLGVLLAARSKKKDGLRYVGSRTRRRRRSP